MSDQSRRNIIKVAYRGTLIGLLFLSARVCAQQNVSALIDQRRDRLESLFTWKVSDELGLDQVTEQKLSVIIKGLGNRKSQINGELNQILNQLRNADKRQSRRLVQKYEDKMKEYSGLWQSEISQIKGLLGADKLARYLVIKDDFAQKMKDIVTANTAKESTNSAESEIARPAAAKDKN